jgi:hypothetical protein
MLDALKYVRYLQAFNEYVVNELIDNAISRFMK